MKKTIALLLAMVLSFGVLTGCGKSDAAIAVDTMISELGEITLDSEKEIVAAEQALGELAEDDAKQVEGTQALADAREKYETLVAEHELAILNEKVASVEAAISEAVKNVSLESEQTILDAYDKYNSADPEVQEKVGNLADLDAALEKISDIRVSKVEELIDTIGTVSLESAEKINEAKAAYKELSDTDKSKLGNYSLLENAEAELKELKKAEVTTLLSAMRCDEDKIRGMSFYYPKCWDFYSDGWAADKRCFVLPYLGVSENSVWLRLVYNYTEDDWVFFTKITILADGQHFYKYYNYRDVVRDTSWGDVFEYMDDEVSDSDIEMLWAIANSEETIVRFEGDTYYYDFTVSAKDKAGIVEALTAYDYLK